MVGHWQGDGKQFSESGVKLEHNEGIASNDHHPEEKDPVDLEERLDEDDDQSSSQEVGQNKCQTLKEVVQTESVNGFQDN